MDKNNGELCGWFAQRYIHKETGWIRYLRDNGSGRTSRGTGERILEQHKGYPA